jgi:glutamate carboxypeptidase
MTRNTRVLALGAALALFPGLARADSAVDLLKKLVELNSGSGQIEGVNAVQSILGREFEAIGFETRLVPPPAGVKTGDLLVAELRGRSEGFITFVIHADTVFEPSSGFTVFKPSADGRSAGGPGVIDDKGGAVVLLEGLREYLAREKPRYSLRVVSSPSEEIGTPGFTAGMFAEFSRQAVLVLGFEPALEDGNVVSSRRGNRWYAVDVQGREAHAGRAHRQGINACAELAAKVSELTALTDYAKDVTVSVGHMEGGQDKFNIVCGSASAKVDARFATIKDRDALQARIDAILGAPEIRAASDLLTSTITYRIDSQSAPFEKQPSAGSYLKSYLAALAASEGGTFSDEKSGGAADSNAFAREGLPIIDGLGPVGAGMHTKAETIFLPSLKTRAHALAAFLSAVGK